MGRCVCTYDLAAELLLQHRVMPLVARKYIPLTAYLKRKRGRFITLSFDQIEEITGEPLPNSAKVLKRRWWSNNIKGRTQGTGWLNAGRRVVGLEGTRVCFRREN